MSLTQIGIPLASMFVMHGGLAAQPPSWVERIAFWKTAEVDGLRQEICTSASDTQHVTVDLGEPREIDEIRLAPAWTARMPWDSYYGFPARFMLEGSASGHDGSWFMIYDRSEVTLKSPGRNLQIFREIPQPARFIRMTATYPHPYNSLEMTLE